MPIPLTKSNFSGMHFICGNTPCNTTMMPVTQYLTNHEIQLVDQTRGPPGPIFMTKTPDCILFTDQNRRFLSVLHSKKMYENEGDPEIKHCTLSCQVGIPGKPLPDPLLVSLEHGVNQPHVISRMSPYKHVLAQISTIQKLDQAPKELFSSDKLGTFSGRIIKGEHADLLKKAFLGLHEHLVQNSGGEDGVFNRSIKLVPELSDLLMLKNPDGDIHLERLPDGIVGYRKRMSDNGQSFIFVANSDDFHQNNVSPIHESQVQVFKMDYNKKGKAKSNARISFVANQNEIAHLSDEVKENGVVHAGMTVQDVLNHIRFAFMKNELENIGCQCFPQYIQCLEKHSSE